MNSANQLMKAFGLQKPEFEFKFKWGPKSLKEMAEEYTTEYRPTAVNLDVGSPTGEQDEVIKNILRNHIYAHTGYGRIWADDLPRLQVALDQYIDVCITEGRLPARVRGRAVVSYDLSTGMANIFYPVNEEVERMERQQVVSREALRRVNRTRFA